MQNYNSKFKSDLQERCYKFGLAIIALADTLPNKRSAWIIIDQLIRSATSIGDNIIEAKTASSNKAYINFYSHALKSANETIYWLSLLKEYQSANSEKVDSLLDEVKQLSNILAASILTMNGKRTV